MAAPAPRPAPPPPPPAQDVFHVPPLSTEDEDALIHIRITNDERPLRRLAKKFHTYAAVAYGTPVPPPPSAGTSVADAREALLVELASFELFLRKTMLVCAAEARQVEEYQRERHQIANEHEALREQIDNLKGALERAQVERRRKIEYDLVAERINTLPSREQLDLAIAALENDMQAIRAEHDTQDRTIRARKGALDGIVAELGQLRLLGRESAGDTSRMPSPGLNAEIDITLDGTESAEDAASGGNAHMDADGDGGVKRVLVKEGSADSGEIVEEKAIAGPSSATLLNPAVRPFQPRHSALRYATGSRASSHPATPSAALSNAPSPAPSRPDEHKREDGEEDEGDIEMGEVEEVRVKVRKVREDREEGEASDESSDLSDPPDE